MVRKVCLISFLIFSVSSAKAVDLVSVAPTVSFDRTLGDFFAEKGVEVFAGMSGGLSGETIQRFGVRWRYAKLGASVVQIGSIPLFNSAGEEIGSVVPRGIVGFGGIDWTVKDIVRLELLGKFMVEDLIASVGRGFAVDGGATLNYGVLVLGAGVRNAAGELKYESHSEKIPMEVCGLLGLNLKVNAYTVGVSRIVPFVSVNYDQSKRITLKGAVKSRMVMSEHLVLANSAGAVYSIDTVSPFFAMDIGYKKFRLGVSFKYNITLGVFSFSTMASFSPDGFVSLDDLDFLIKKDEIQSEAEEETVEEEEEIEVEQSPEVEEEQGEGEVQEEEQEYEEQGYEEGGEVLEEEQGYEEQGEGELEEQQGGVEENGEGEYEDEGYEEEY